MNETSSSSPRVDAYELALRIAAHMGDEWVAKAPKLENTAYSGLTRTSDGAEIYISTDRKKAHFGCEWPMYANGERWRLGHGVSSPRITCAVGRDAKTLAAEIKRRLLPEYLPLYEKACADVRQSNTGMNQQTECAARVAAAIGGKVRETSGQSVGARSEIRDGIDHVYNLHVSGEKIYFEVTGIPEVLAVQILNLIKGSERKP